MDRLHFHTLDSPRTYIICSESPERLASQEEVTQVFIFFSFKEKRECKMISPQGTLISQMGIWSQTVCCFSDFPTVMSDGYLENQVLGDFPYSFRACESVCNNIRLRLSASTRAEAANHCTRERPKELLMNVNIGIVTTWVLFQKKDEVEEVAAVMRDSMLPAGERGHGAVPSAAASREAPMNERFLQGSGDSTVCVVCKEGTGEGVEMLPMVPMPCDHGFHEKCIVPWLKHNNSCPLCGTKLPACSVSSSISSLRLASYYPFVGVFRASHAMSC